MKKIFLLLLCFAPAFAVAQTQIPGSGAALEGFAAGPAKTQKTPTPKPDTKAEATAVPYHPHLQGTPSHHIPHENFSVLKHKNNRGVTK